MAIKILIERKKKKKYDKKSKKYRVCTVSVGDKAGTRERSEWDKETKAKYDRCLDSVESQDKKKGKSKK